MKTPQKLAVALLLALALGSPTLRADDNKAKEDKGKSQHGLCEGLPSHAELQELL
jgi:hypothetical protein